MKNKQSTLTKLDSQVQKLKFIQRKIETSTISGPEAIQLIQGIINDLELLHERLEIARYE